jgi:hypothetical protein
MIPTRQASAYLVAKGRGVIRGWGPTWTVTSAVTVLALLLEAVNLRISAKTQQLETAVLRGQ